MKKMTLVLPFLFGLGEDCVFAQEPAHTFKDPTIRDRLLYRNGVCGNSSDFETIRVDLKTGRLNWYRIAREDLREYAIAEIALPFRRVVRIISLGDARVLAVGQTETEKGIFCALQFQGSPTYCIRFLGSAIESDHMPCWVTLNRSTNALYMIDGTRQSIYRTSATFDSSNELVLSAFEFCFNQSLCPLLNETHALYLTIVILTEPNNGLPGICVWKKTRASPMHYEKRGGSWLKVIGSSTSSSLQNAWEIKRSLLEVTTDGFFVRGPAGLFQVVNKASGEVIGTGISQGGQWVYFNGSGRLLPGQRYFVRGEGAQSSNSPKVYYRKGFPVSNADIHIGPGKARGVRIGNRNYCILHGSINLQEVQSLDTSIVLRITIAARPDGTPPPVVTLGSNEELHGDMTEFYARTVKAGRRSADGFLLAIPELIMLQGVTLYFQVGATVAGASTTAMSDVFGLKLN